MNSPLSLSTLEPSKAISRIRLQIEKAENLKALPHNDPERTQWYSTSRGLLVAGFHPVHNILRDFDKNNQLIPSLHDSPRQRQERRNKQLDRYIAVMRSAIEQLEWNLPTDSEHFMPTGSQHDAYQQIRSIIQATKTQIFIVDNYVDESTWQLLTNVSATVAIRILTTKMQNDFALEGKHFKAQHGNTVEVRKTGKVHDRFIVIDRARGWHLGPSIKDAGSKAALISEIHSPSVIAAATQEIENLWNTSTVVTI